MLSVDRRDKNSLRSTYFLESFHFGRHPMRFYSSHFTFCLNERINAQHIINGQYCKLCEAAKLSLKANFISDLKLHLMVHLGISRTNRNVYILYVSILPDILHTKKIDTSSNTRRSDFNLSGSIFDKNIEL